MPTVPDAPDAQVFVVLLWRERGAAGLEWRGRVEHVGTGEVRYATSVAGIAECIEQLTGAGGQDERA